MSGHFISIWSSLSLGGTLALSSGGVRELGELAEGSLLVVVVEESLGLDGLGALGGAGSHSHDGGGGVALRLHVSLGDAVLGLVLQSHGESSAEIVLGYTLGGGDADGVAGLAGVVEAVHGEGGVRPVLAVPLSFHAVPFLGQAPDDLR